MDEELSFGKKTWTSLSLTNRRQTWGWEITLIGPRLISHFRQQLRENRRIFFLRWKKKKKKKKKKRKKKLPWIDTRWLSTVNYGQLIEGKPIFRWTSNQGTIVGRLDTFYQWLITEDRLNFSFSCVSFFVDTSVRYIFLRNRYGKYEKLMRVGKISETFYDSIIKRRKKEKQWRNRLI